MSDDEFELSRRKVLGGLGTVGIASAGAGLGTTAFFNDTESFSGNSVQAGELDLLVDYETNVDQAGVSTGSSLSATGTIDGDDDYTYDYSIADAKPGDSGSLVFCPKVVDNPAWIWVGSEDGLTNYENGQTEPEGSVDSSGGGDIDSGINDGAGAGDLSDAIQVTVSYCDTSGSNKQPLNNPSNYTLTDLVKDLENGFLLDGDQPDGDAGPDAYPGSSNAGDQQGPCLCIDWTIPESVGNGIQSDAVEFNFRFYAVQERHNDSLVNPFVDRTVGSGSGFDHSTIQAAIDASSPGDQILVQSGTYEETLNLQGKSDLIIRGSSGVTVKPTSTLAWGSETSHSSRTTGIRVVNSSGVSFRNLVFDFEEIDDSAVTGLLFWESVGEVCGCTLRDMSHANDAVDMTAYLGTNDAGSSIYGDSNRARIEFRRNEFVETGRIGINVQYFVDAIVTDNTFETTDAGYAVEVGSEGTGIVRNNEIHGYNTDFSDGSESAGIYVENAFTTSSPGLVKTVLVTGNEVYNCTYGIRIGNEWHTLAGDVDIEAILTRNYVHDNQKAGISLTDSGAEDGSSVSVVASHNTLEDNESGYHVFEDNEHSQEDDGNITLDAEREAITGNDVGVLIESTSTSPVTSFQSVAVTESNIENNSSYGIQNTVGDLSVSAENNWWGASSGPSGQGSGSGDAVSSNVDIAPSANSQIPDAGV